MDNHQPLWNLPPPSQLHLQAPDSNTLPPINHHHPIPNLHHWDLKHDPMLHSKDPQPSLASPSPDDPMPSTSDFVKKLFKMLEDQSFQHVVSWGPQGDCFVVKDMNEFTKSILPRMFKHSNFASFVRQLNKYDFHKVKISDDNQFGEHSWTFRHPDFHANRKDALENIKRKVPATRKASTPTSSSTTTRPLSPSHYSSHQPHHHPYQSSSCVQTQVHVETLQDEIRRLREEGEDMRTRIRTLERNYENVLLELVSFQRGMAQQDSIMQNLIGYFMNSESGKSKSVPAAFLSSQQQQQQPQRRSPPPSQPQNKTSHPQQPLPIYGPTSSTSRTSDSTQQDHRSPFLPYHAAQRVMRRCPETTDVARATLLQMSEMSRRAEDIGFTYAEGGEGGGGGGIPGLNDDPPGAARSAPGSSSSSSPSAAAALPAAGTNLGTTSSSLAARREATIPTLARPSSRIWQAAANAGLFNGLGAFTGSSGGGAAAAAAASGSGGASQNQPTMMSRQEILESLEELQRRGKMEGGGGDSWQGLSGGPSGPGASGSASTGAFGRSTAAGSVGGGGGESSSAGPSANAWGSPSSASIDDEGSHPIMTHEGLQVYTVGHLLPREAVLDNSSWSVDMSGDGSGSGSGSGMIFGLERPREQRQSRLQQQTSEFSSFPYPGLGKGSREGSAGSLQGEEDEDDVIRPSPNQGGMLSSEATTASLRSNTRKLRVRRSTFVPGWAVPPRVLLVDDDAVTRKLSSKYLQVFGCTIDVAVDGVGAVNKMNLEKYDLVLMDIVMPKLDGVSATSLIRKFDCMTPIISMTSNSKPNEILNYFSSGMNDILPKPFTKQGLLDMLEKHLTHLRAIQQLSRVSRPLEISNSEGSGSRLGSSSSKEMQAFDSSTESSRREDDDRISPIAGLGLTDEQYNLIIQDIVNAETFGGSSSGMGADDASRMGGGPSGSNVMLEGIGMMSVAMLGIGEKRNLEDSTDGREGKRSRFEVIE